MGTERLRLLDSSRNLANQSMQNLFAGTRSPVYGRNDMLRLCLNVPARELAHGEAQDVQGCE